MITMAQNTPGNIVVKPMMLKYAATPARERADPKTKNGKVIINITLIN
jgi:hypothetical protein